MNLARRGVDGAMATAGNGSSVEEKRNSKALWRPGKLREWKMASKEKLNNTSSHDKNYSVAIN